MTKRSWLADSFGLLMLVVGSLLLPIIGYAVGVWFVWTSARWSRSEKIAAVALWPVALLVPLILFQVTSSDSPSDSAVAPVVMSALGVAFVAVVARLVWRLHRPTKSLREIA